MDLSKTCPFNTNVYTPIYDQGLADYTNMLTPNIDFRVLLVDYNYDFPTWGTFYYAAVTLKTKGWCDAAHTQLAVEESECSSTPPTPPTPTTPPTSQTQNGSSSDDDKSNVKVPLAAFVILIILAAFSLFTVVLLTLLIFGIITVSVVLCLKKLGSKVKQNENKVDPYQIPTSGQQNESAAFSTSLTAKG